VTTTEVSPYKFCKNGGSTSDKNFIQASTIAHLAGLATDHWSLMQRGNRRQRISSPMLPLVSRFEYTYFARRYALPRCANVTCPENRKCIAIYVHKSLSVQRKHKKHSNTMPPEENRATATRKCTENSMKLEHLVSEISSRTNRQAYMYIDMQTHIVIVIFRSPIL